jgi:acyl-CoA dehydrogenase
VPVGITVEGANILTQNLIIFGQGAIRCHPYLLDEMLALEEPDEAKALDAFDRAFWGHVGHSVANAGRAWARAWTGARTGRVPDAGPVTRHYRRLSRYAAALALVSDIALLTLGGGLKRREMISARLGDILSELYLLSAVLKRFEDEGRQAADLPLVEWCMEVGWDTIEQRLDEVLRNLPSRPWAGLARFLVLPAGPKHAGPDDALIRRCADFLFEPSETRDRLVSGVHCGRLGGGIGDLEDAFALVVEVTPLRARMKEAGIDDIDTARERGVLGPEEAERLHAAKAAVDRVVAVDDFAAEELSPRAAARETDAATAEPATTDRRSARRKEAVS